METTRRAAARRGSAPPEARTTGTQRAVRDPNARPLVLLVDDNEDARELYADFLADRGFRVEQAVDGEHALLKIAALMPDVVVFDVEMPGVDGLEATRQVKTHARTSRIPVVILTGRTSETTRIRATHEGAEAVLTKPCPPHRLLETLERVLGQ